MKNQNSNHAFEGNALAEEKRTSPRPVRVYAPAPKPSRRGAPAGVAWPLWLLLGLSIAVLAAAQVYAQRAEGRLTATPHPAPAILMITPSAAVRAADLHLSWQPVEDAASYRLHVETVTGSIVIDGLTVTDPDWIPPLDALPAFTPGEYRWSVEARDDSDQPLCRSELESFRISGDVL